MKLVHTSRLIRNIIIIIIIVFVKVEIWYHSGQNHIISSNTTGRYNKSFKIAYIPVLSLKPLWIMLPI